MSAAGCLEAAMKRSKPLKPINLVMGASGSALALAVLAWMTSSAIGLSTLDTVGTTLFVTGVVVAFVPLLGVLVAVFVERLRAWWNRRT